MVSTRNERRLTRWSVFLALIAVAVVASFVLVTMRNTRDIRHHAVADRQEAQAADMGLCGVLNTVRARVNGVEAAVWLVHPGMRNKLRWRPVMDCGKHSRDVVTVGFRFTRPLALCWVDPRVQAQVVRNREHPSRLCEHTVPSLRAWYSARGVAERSRA